MDISALMPSFCSKRVVDRSASRADMAVTALGRLALVYMNDSDRFPSDCPDPRIDAQAFADYCKSQGMV